MARKSKKPKIEMVDNLLEMSNFFYQVITLIDCPDQFFETETSLEKAKATVKSFVIDLEMVVKDYTSYEMNLVSLLKENDTNDFSKLEIFDNTSKISNQMNTDISLSRTGRSIYMCFFQATNFKV